MNRIQQLAQLGQSIWYDNIQRRMITAGQLQAMIADGLLGMTSNPSIFEKAIGGSSDYDAALQQLMAAGAGVEQIYDALTIEDVGMAADAFRPVFRHTHSVDGYVSIEVSPKLAHDTAGTLADARRLWQTLQRPNVMIKIPATKEGLPAIEEALFDGLNVNVTLMFSMEHYLAVAEAYLRALERRVAANRRIDHIASVASFFVSRVDTLLDKKLEDLMRAEGRQARRAADLMGKAAVANSQLVYEKYCELFDSERFLKLAAHGARKQRVLWASTSTKNPSYPDTLYVDTLIGLDTVNTVPPETYIAILEHTVIQRTVDADLTAARQVVADLAALGFDLNAVGEQLSIEGVDKFSKSFDGLLAVIAAKCAQFAAPIEPPASTKRSGTKKAAAKKPATQRLAAKKPLVKKAAATKPKARKPAAKNPIKKAAAKKSVKKTAARQATSKRAAVKKTAKKLTVRKPVARPRKTR